MSEGSIELADWDSLYSRQDELQQDAIRFGRRLIRGELQELEARFTRHRFSWLDGMGTAFLEVSPPVRGETILNHAHLGSGEVATFLSEVEERIHDKIATPLGDDFGVEFGRITTDNEDED